MPKIDPSQLLDCLDSLLGSDGGIKGETEVKRLAVLMTKFSKKLVSKCIYILILKNTEPDLLAKFMAEGGWALVFQWLDEGICHNNHPLIREILELLLKCPISLDRLKENNCPKVVKGLSKDSESEEVKRLAGKLVEQWLKFIKSGQAAISDVAMASVTSASVPKPAIAVLPSNITVVSAVSLNPSSTAEVKKPGTLTRKVSKSGIQILHEVSSSDEEEVPPIGSLPLYKITVRDGKSVLAKVGTKTLTLPVPKKSDNEIESPNTVVLKSEPIQKKFKYIAKPVSEKEKLDGSEHLINDLNSSDRSDMHKIVSTANSEILSKQKIAVLDKEDENEYLLKDKEKLVESAIKHIVLKPNKDGTKSKNNTKISRPSKESDNYKNDLRQKDKDKKSNKESDKERKKEYKAHKTDKSKERERDREREKYKGKEKEFLKEKHKDSDKNRSKTKYSQGKDVKIAEKILSAAEKAQIQADKDKDTLERLKTPAINLLGKIPKKPSQSSTTLVSNNLINKSLDNQENSDKQASAGSSVKKSYDGKNPKVRPKTVKTFNSKFRSTGLEEEVKPPPPRNSIKKKSMDKKVLPKSESSSKSVTLATAKDGQPPEKKLKVSEVSVELKKDKVLEKPGGVKLIPPKPKLELL